MKQYMLFLLISLSYNMLFSQTVRSISVKAGEDIAQAYSPQGFYRFPQFSTAALFFKGGASQKSQVLFNYNLYSGYMQFISPKGDTLDMVNRGDLDSITFPKNVFLFNEGFLEVVSRMDSIKLLKKIVIKTDIENIGAYGTSNKTSSIDKLITYSSGAGVYNLVLSQNVVLNENVYWFFSNGNHNLLKANKSNLLKLLPLEKQTKAETYLKENKINFERENDLKKLVEAIGS